MSWRTSAVIVACLAISLTVATARSDGFHDWVTPGSQAAALVGYVLLWAAVESGLAIHMHVHVPRLRPATLLEVHRISSTLGFAFITGHVWGLLVDPMPRVGSLEIFVPFAPVDHMLARTAGSLGFWATLGTLTTSALASRIPYRAWRRAHFLTFPAFFLSLLHGVLAGSRFEPGAWSAFYLVTGGLVAVTCFARAISPRRSPSRRAQSPVERPRLQGRPPLRLRGQHSSAAFERLLSELRNEGFPLRRWPNPGGSPGKTATRPRDMRAGPSGSHWRQSSGPSPGDARARGEG